MAAFTQTFTASLRLGGLQFKNLKDATTGYSTVADWTDTTPQPGSASSGAALEDPNSYLSFVWDVYALSAVGRVIETGGGTSKESWGIFGE